MALVDYMGDAPGFMSYSRQPLTGFSHLPTFKAPPKAPSISPDLKSEDDKGLSGDAEFYSNTQKSFEQGISELSKKYGGELNAFALSSPEYKELVKKQQHDVYSKQSLRNNEIKKKQYDSDLLASTNGQHADDIALEWNESIKDYTDKQFKIPDGKGGYVTSGPLTKKQYSDLSESKPNIDYVDKEGNLAIVPIEYDYGKGDAETTINEVNNMLTNTGFKKTGGGKDDTIRVSINGVTDQQLRNWSDGHHMDNFDAINGLSKFINEKGGLSKDSKYFLAQNFRNKISDPVNGGYEYFEFDEQGKPVPQKGGGHKRRHYTQEEIDSNPMLKNMMQKEFQVNFVQDYLTTKKTLDTYGKRGSVFENLDRSGQRTGGVDKPEDKYFWRTMAYDNFNLNAPAGETTPVLRVDENGNVHKSDGKSLSITDTENPYQLEKVRKTLIGKTVKDFGGSIGLQGLFQKAGSSIGNGVILGVDNVTQVSGQILAYDPNSRQVTSVTDPKQIKRYKETFNTLEKLKENGQITPLEYEKRFQAAGFLQPTAKFTTVIVGKKMGDSPEQIYSFEKGATGKPGTGKKKNAFDNWFGYSKPSDELVNEGLHVDINSLPNASEIKTKYPEVTDGVRVMIYTPSALMDEYDKSDFTAAQKQKHTSTDLINQERAIRSEGASGGNVSKVKR